MSSVSKTPSPTSVKLETTVTLNASTTGAFCSAFDLAAFSQSSGPETWRVVKSAFNIDRSSQRIESTPTAPVLAGAIESLEVTDPDLLRIRETSPHIQATLKGMEGENPELLLRLDQPAPGLAHIFTMAMGGVTDGIAASLSLRRTRRGGLRGRATTVG